MTAGIDILKKYPTIAHNYISYERIGNKIYPQINNLPRGFKHLLTWEPHIIRPENWDLDVINQFDSFVTSNKKFCDLYSNRMSATPYVTKYWAGGSIDVSLDSFKFYDEKIKGICLFGKYGRETARAREGSIYFLREQLLKQLFVEPHLVKHLYAYNPWGGRFYCGRCQPYDPWGISVLKKVSEYLFCFCPENTYHPLWSWGYLTERLIRCFKAKTIGIYIGCYNIDDLIPKGLYIDFRDFYGDYAALADYLIKFPKEKYIEMTEKAYEWDKNNKRCLTDDFEKLLKFIVANENNAERMSIK